MPTRTWDIDLEDGAHSVTVKQHPLTGMGRIWVDGVQLPMRITSWQMMTRWGGTYPLGVQGHGYVLRVSSNGFTYSHKLDLDAQCLYMTQQQVVAPPPLPRWAWPFIAACVLMPVATLGGVVPILLGVGGAAGCTSVAQRQSAAPLVRIMVCVSITIFCWALLVTFMVQLHRHPGLL